MTTPYVIGIGNAVMDVIAPVAEDRLSALGIQKGIMQLVDLDRSDELMAAEGQLGRNPRARLIPGGSVANTLAGIGQMGLKTAFIGRVADDALGLSYAEQTEGAGTIFVNPPVGGDPL
ncbi:MAG: PfkB family carbohydrate kinase, partial [Paracoccus sp. (in: a-proteobacteria)]|nr:PfkB family carbohydrate kinase [Paracoccus sp. (in: a-proteobacteria)]